MKLHNPNPNWIRTVKLMRFLCPAVVCLATYICIQDIERGEQVGALFAGLLIIAGLGLSYVEWFVFTLKPRGRFR